MDRQIQIDQMEGVTPTPWKSGRLLVWDATCPDTFAPSYRAQATQGPGKVAAAAEERKEEKYRCLPPGHYFSPVAIETMGAVGPKSMVLLRDVGRRIAEETGEVRARDFVSAAFSGGAARELCLRVGNDYHLTLLY